MPPKRRTPISNAQRVAVRQRAKQTPKLTQHGLRDWFEARYHHPVSQASISETLSKRYDFLDDSSRPVEGGRKRMRPAQWPELESALYHWVLQTEAEKGESVAGEQLRRQAIHFWQTMPPYQGLEVPAFSNGWMQGFKNRHHLGSKRPRRDATTSADDEVDAEGEVVVDGADDTDLIAGGPSLEEPFAAVGMKLTRPPMNIRLVEESTEPSLYQPNPDILQHTVQYALPRYMN